MMKSRITVLLVVLSLIFSACGLKFEPNDDGSTRMEIRLDEAAMQTRIQQSISDPLVEEFNVELRDGFIEISGTRENAQTGNLDTLSYRLDLGAADGHMTAVILQRRHQWFPAAPGLAGALERKHRQQPGHPVKTIPTAALNRW